MISLYFSLGFRLFPCWKLGSAPSPPLGLSLWNFGVLLSTRSGSWERPEARSLGTSTCCLLQGLFDLVCSPCWNFCMKIELSSLSRSIYSATSPNKLNKEHLSCTENLQEPFWGIKTRVQPRYSKRNVILRKLFGAEIIQLVSPSLRFSRLNSKIWFACLSVWQSGWIFKGNNDRTGILEVFWLYMRQCLEKQLYRL